MSETGKGVRSSLVRYLFTNRNDEWILSADILIENDVSGRVVITSTMLPNGKAWHLELNGLVLSSNSTTFPAYWKAGCWVQGPTFKSFFPLRQRVKQFPRDLDLSLNYLGLN